MITHPYTGKKSSVNGSVNGSVNRSVNGALMGPSEIPNEYLSVPVTECGGFQRVTSQRVVPLTESCHHSHQRFDPTGSMTSINGLPQRVPGQFSTGFKDSSQRLQGQFRWCFPTGSKTVPLVCPNGFQGQFSTTVPLVFQRQFCGVSQRASGTVPVFRGPVY